MGCTNGYNMYSMLFEHIYAKHIYPYIEMSLLYLRYTDEISMAWKGTKAELMNFLKELNEKPKKIKFDLQI